MKIENLGFMSLVNLETCYAVVHWCKTRECFSEEKVALFP